MAFSWFDASEAKQFGKALAQFYLAKLPVDTDRADKKYPNKDGRANWRLQTGEQAQSL